MRPRDVKRLFGFPSRSRDDVRDGIAEEFRLHLDLRTDELVRSGHSYEAARRQALEEFGDPSAAVTRCAVHDDGVERRHRVTRLLEELRQDATLGMRQLLRSPGFAVVAVLTL